MNFYKIAISLLAISPLICTTEKHIPTQDCGLVYNTEDLNMELDTLTADVRFVVFKDDSSSVDTTYISTSLSKANIHLQKAKLKLKLHSIDVINNKEYAEDFSSMRKHAQQLNKDDVFNVYVYSDNQPYLTGNKAYIRGEAADIPSRTVGIVYRYLNSSTFIHEIGHCLGLFHTHEPDDTDGLNPITGDRVCDTRSLSPNLIGADCHFVGADSLRDNTIECNIMSYIPLGCRDCFSEGQIDRIRFMIFNNETLGHLFGVKKRNNL